MSSWGRLTGAVLTIALGGSLALAGCGTVPDQPAPNNTPNTGQTGATAPASPSPTPSPTPTPAACPSGTYRITAFKGQGSAAKLGSGVGGDVTIAFTDGTFTLHSDGQDPIKVQLGPANANLTIAGDITGTYRGDPSALTMSVKDASGTATLKGGFVNRSLTMRQLADQLVPLNATGTATCNADQTVITLPNVALTLAPA